MGIDHSKFAAKFDEEAVFVFCKLLCQFFVFTGSNQDSLFSDFANSSVLIGFIR